MAENPFLLPHEIMDASAVPAHLRERVAYQVLAGKYCALVEAAMRLTGGEPIEISLSRVQEILGFDHLSDPRVTVMVAEAKVSEDTPELVNVRLATVEEKQAANRRYALSRMGASRN